MNAIVLFVIVFVVIPSLVVILIGWFCDKKDKESQKEVEKPKVGNYLKAEN